VAKGITRSIFGNPLSYFIIGCIVLAPIGIFWFLANFEQKDVEIWRGKSPAASNNPLLAAERYLNLTGGQAESVSGLKLLTSLPPSEDTIVIYRLPAGLGQTVTDGLLAWVDGGGHLLLVPDGISTTNPNTPVFISRIGVRLLEDQQQNDSDCGCPADESDTSEVSADETLDGQQQHLSDVGETDNEYRPYNKVIETNISGHWIKLESNAWRYLEDIEGTAIHRIPGSYHKEYIDEEDDTRADNNQLVERQGDWLLQYAFGKGKITVFSEIRLFTSDQIGKKDHAFFLSQLIGDTAKVWFIYSSNVDSLWAIVWQKFPLFWISLIFTIFLVVWMFQMRSGPMEKPFKNASQNVLTHIVATGRYCWKRDRCADIVAINRRHSLLWWQRRRQGPGSRAELTADDMARLTEGTGLSAQQLEAAFFLSPNNEQDFIRSSQALQTFHLALHGGEKKHND
jgi:nitrate reductase NapE component